MIHVTEPLNRRSSGVVRTTSPVAPSLTIKMFILAQSISMVAKSRSQSAVHHSAPLFRAASSRQFRLIKPPTRTIWRGRSTPPAAFSDSSEIMGTPGVKDRIDSAGESGQCAVRRAKRRCIFPCNVSSFFIEIHDLSTSLCRQVTTSVVCLASLSMKVVSIIPKPNARRRRMLI